ncbi:MAG: CoA transferase [Rhodoferax sp.]|nr:CoA transferase [Rhodoferax sp.]MCB2008422.1 CoA transferase [Rhodoferax sp.]MCB2029611.1 CoA transferase [Rhodoferax sp.]MCB2039470.1 CoA transferase [Rhodoferax sp.]MCP5263586.1 CoA transferase [Rhodoferax sp.]
MKLEGIRVLDLSQFLPGPHFTMMMADHGADVIRIEPPSGEPTRNIGVRQANASVWFRNTHRGKKSVVLDLKRVQGVAAFMALAASADVIVEAFRPGVVDRLGIGYDKVSQVNPRIVYVSIAAFGQTGPMVQRPAHDVSIQAETGLVDLNRGNDGKPVLPNMPSADMAASLMAMNGVLMALLRRASTGVGDYIDISMQDSLASWLVNVVGPAFGEDRDMTLAHERGFGGAAFYNVYACGDGQFLTLGGSEIKFAANLLTALGRSDLIDLCRLPPGPGQLPVKQFLRETFAAQPLAHWESFLAPLDVCWAPVRTLRQALQSEQIRARGMRVEVAQKGFGGGMVTELGIPIKFRHEPGRVDPEIPELGEHTFQVLQSLGLSAEEVSEASAMPISPAA